MQKVKKKTKKKHIYFSSLPGYIGSEIHRNVLILRAGQILQSVHEFRLQRSILPISIADLLSIKATVFSFLKAPCFNSHTSCLSSFIASVWLKFITNDVTYQIAFQNRFVHIMLLQNTMMFNVQ